MKRFHVPMPPKAATGCFGPASAQSDATPGTPGAPTACCS
jgi:hypothetical protein